MTRLNPHRWIAGISLIVLVGFSLASEAASAAGKPVISVNPPKLSAPVAGKAALLIPATYPLEMSGRSVKGRVQIKLPRGKAVIRKWSATPHAGRLRRADRRATFRFVQAIPIGRALTRALRKRGREASLRSLIGYHPPASESMNSSSVSAASDSRGLFRAPASMCSTPPRLSLVAKPGSSVRQPVPRCGARLRWSVSDQPELGNARVSGSSFSLIQGDHASGADEIELTGRRRGMVVAKRVVQLRVALALIRSISVRAMGDSVTAGFGYYGKSGKLMPFTSLLDCKPGATVYNDACSSNSSNTSSAGTDPNYLADYGLSRNISWAAQWANEYGVTDYRNYAVSGSAPIDWLPGGQFDATRQKIEQQNPDYILMTMGGNPLLSDMLFGVDQMGCALESDLFGDYRACIEAAFASVDLSQRLNALYSELVQNTTSHLVVMQYHLSIPASAILYSSAQIEMMGELMNGLIADAARTVSPERITVISPPRFNVGIDMRPQYPAKFSCSWFGLKVDGPSVQSSVTQVFLDALHLPSFCPGPPSGAPWVISGDTGIHPSAVGYTQMAGQVPAPE